MKKKKLIFLQILEYKIAWYYFPAKEVKRQFHNKHNSILPLIVYNNIKTEKALVMKENKGKTGVYCLTNLVNWKTYIGSANNLTVRFWVYFSTKRLINSNLIIYKAILKYGHENFKLEILEYCSRVVVRTILYWSYKTRIQYFENSRF